jgi:hypothetical protein
MSEMIAIIVENVAKNALPAFIAQIAFVPVHAQLVKWYAMGYVSIHRIIQIIAGLAIKNAQPIISASPANVYAKRV